ncbi:MAG TPA: thioredoxin family protein [Myxococcaceae bacterium]|nr:thioredoxin family protein [Myxococcaceae bacterium]
MGNRFNVKLAWSEDPERKEMATPQVKELAEKDYEAEVVGAELPVVLDFYALESKACQTLAPRFAAVAGKFAGKVRFLKVSRQANAGLAARLGVTATPTVVFLHGGTEKAERLSGDDIQRTALKARVEAMLGLPVAKPAA